MMRQAKPPLLVDVPLVKQILIRLMTRNQLDQGKAGLDRIELGRVLETLHSAPELHLATVIEIIGKRGDGDPPPSFEAGLLFGVTLALTSRSPNGRLMLNRMLADIRAQQDAAVPSSEVR